IGRRGEVRVPRGTDVINATGRFVLPGFWNSHVHLLDPSVAEKLMHYGFTTVVDSGSVLEKTLVHRRRIDAGEIDGPRIITAGEPVFPPGGSPVMLKPLVMPEIRDASEAAAIVDAHRGAEALKLYMVSWMNPGQPAMALAPARALAAEAHRRGM